MMSTLVLIVALLTIALVLVAMEIIVIPGFGFAGILGGAMIVVAVWLTYRRLGPGYGAVAVLVSLVMSGGLVWLLPRSRAGKRMVLSAQHTTQAPDSSLSELIGRSGTAITPLRPAGIARIDGRPIDVVTDGQYIEQQTPIRVLSVEGVRVVVEESKS